MSSSVVSLNDGRGPPATKDRILDAAEGLFMEHGFEATSLRSITAAAAVNLAAVNYHFGSKEELFQAVLTRRLDPMNQRRLALLDRFEREEGDGNDDEPQGRQHGNLRRWMTEFARVIAAPGCRARRRSRASPRTGRAAEP